MFKLHVDFQGWFLTCLSFKKLASELDAWVKGPAHKIPPSTTNAGGREL